MLRQYRAQLNNSWRQNNWRVAIIVWTVVANQNRLAKKRTSTANQAEELPGAKEKTPWVCVYVCGVIAL